MAGALLVAATAWASGASVPIDRFEVSGNTLLPQACVDEALGTAGADMDVPAMQAAAQRLQDAYRAAGWGAVVVLLPEQQPGSRVLHLQVVEGRVSQISTAGQYRFSRDNVLRSVPRCSRAARPVSGTWTASCCWPTPIPRNTAACCCSRASTPATWRRSSP